MSEDIFDAIEEAREKSKKVVDLGPLSRLVKRQALLEAPAEDRAVDMLYDVVQEYELSVDDLEEVLKKRKKDLFNLRQVQIPAVMEEYELDEIRTNDGTKIEIKDGLSITTKDKEKLHTFITDDGSGDLIKKNITVTLESEENEKEVIAVLEKVDCLFEKKEGIHHQTLLKYVRGCLEKGKSIPDGIIKIYEYKYSKIKKGK